MNGACSTVCKRLGFRVSASQCGGWEELCSARHFVVDWFRATNPTGVRRWSVDFWRVLVPIWSKLGMNLRQIRVSRKGSHPTELKMQAAVAASFVPLSATSFPSPEILKIIALKKKMKDKEQK